MIQRYGDGTQHTGYNNKSAGCCRLRKWTYNGICTNRSRGLIPEALLCPASQPARFLPPDMLIHFIGLRTDICTVLSMALSSSREFYITSSADAMIAKHPFPIRKSIWNTELKPITISQTKHSGQQGLRIRSDGKIFATAGWDARIRVYSAKTMNELAVLRWHKTGCYATAFAQTDVVIPARIKPEFDAILDQNEVEERVITKKSSAVTGIQQRRDEVAQTTHWLAAGSKDGKVSLWDIY